MPQHGLGHAADEKRLEELLVGLMKEQIAVKLPIAGQSLIEKDSQHGFGLLDDAEGVRLAVQNGEMFAQR